jgi:hypothetical protein
MKRIIQIMIIGFLMILQGCTIEDLEEPFCDCNNPLKDLEWLNTKYKAYKKDSYNHSSIYMVMYNGEDGFLTSSCIPYNDGAALYDCFGELVCFDNEIGTGNCPDDFWDKITYQELLWEHENCLE